MRRTVPLAVPLVVVVLALAGCGKRPAGIDGDLTNGWSAMTEPAAVPRAGACYDVALVDPAVVGLWPAPVACTTSHNVETAFVGEFAGEDRNRPTVPLAGGPERRRAYAECMAKTRDYLGGDWRTARLTMSLVTPFEPGWAAGARWFRCDLTVFQVVAEDVSMVSHAASVKGVLGTAAGAGLNLGCAKFTDQEHWVEVSCDTPHNAEFAGIHDYPDVPFPTGEQAGWSECHALAARYVGVSEMHLLRASILGMPWPFGEESWALGNRGVRCYLYTGDEKATKSLKGVGPRGVPVR